MLPESSQDLKSDALHFHAQPRGIVNMTAIAAVEAAGGWAGLRGRGRVGQRALRAPGRRDAAPPTRFLQADEGVGFA